MALTDQVTRIKNLIAKSYTSVKNKRGTMPSSQTIANLPAAIDSIVLGSGDAVVSDVKEGKTFTNDGGVQLTGTFAAQEKTITANGTYTPDSGKYFSSIIANVPANFGTPVLKGTGTYISFTATQRCLLIGCGGGIRNGPNHIIAYMSISSNGTKLFNKTDLYVEHDAEESQNAYGHVGGAAYVCEKGQYMTISFSNLGGGNACLYMIPIN